MSGGLDPFEAALGAQVRRLRRSRGKPARWLAERIGVSFQQVGRYESGKDRIAASTLVRICNALGGDIGELCRPFHDPAPAPAGDPLQRLTQAYLTIEDRRARAHVLALTETLARLGADPADPARTPPLR